MKNRERKKAVLDFWNPFGAASDCSTLFLYEKNRIPL